MPIALPLADPSEISFAIVQQPFEPAAAGVPSRGEEELP
jgi:hypothetical protein